MLSTFIIHYLKASEKDDVSILIWHMIKMKQSWQEAKLVLLYQVNGNFWKWQKTQSIHKDKAQSDCAPFAMSPDSTSYELGNVMIYVDHDKHVIYVDQDFMWNKREYVLSWHQKSPWITTSNVI